MMVALPGLDARDPVRPEAAGQPTGGRRGHRGHRREELRGGVGPVPVQGVDELAIQKLALRQTGHQLTAADSEGAGLDRADPGIQRLDHPESVHQLTDREHPRRPGQRGVRGPEPHPAASPPSLTASRLPSAATTA